MIKVLIVDDSITFREWLNGLFLQGGDFSVVGMASSGEEAIKRINELNPDVVVLDYIMPQMSGLDVTQQIMTVKPVPIVILSAEPKLADGTGFSQSLGAGALFFFEKPGKEVSRKRWEENFLRTCRAASRVPVLRRMHQGSPRKPAAPQEEAREISLIGIGASTGGPQTLAAILKALPPVPAPVVIVLHSSEGLSEQILEWYSALIRMPMEILRTSRSIDDTPRIYIAPAGKHVELRGRFLSVTDGPPRNFCKPSVDVFFDSMVSLKGKALAILLTGMGRDGAQGLKAIRDQGGVTIAQDEATSIIYGMPKAAAELGAAQHILPAPKIAAVISGYFAKEKTDA